jgi:hypothetical protein
MRKNAVVELHEFSPLEGISDDALLKAIRKAETRFFRRQPCFIRCEILRFDNDWISLSYWRSKEEAQQTLANFPNHPSYFPLILMIAPTTERRLYMEIILTTTGIHQ